MDRPWTVQIEVTYDDGPPVPPELEAELAEWWRRRIERITAEMLGCGAYSGLSTEWSTNGQGRPVVGVPESGT